MSLCLREKKNIFVFIEGFACEDVIDNKKGKEYEKAKKIDSTVFNMGGGFVFQRGYF